MKKQLILIGLLLLTLAACDPAPKGIGCEEISLRHDCLDLLPKPIDAPRYSANSPGDSKLLPRSFNGVPPQIPHTIEGMDINKDGNMCLACHQFGGEGVPVIPESHHKVPVVALGKVDTSPQTTRITGYDLVADDYNPARYFCTQCHVPQAGNLKPLVLNRF